MDSSLLGNFKPDNPVGIVAIILVSLFIIFIIVAGVVISRKVIGRQNAIADKLRGDFKKNI